MVQYREIELRSRERTHWLDITSEVERVVSESDVTAGVCIVSSLHTTGGVTINENSDPDVQRDFFHKLNQMVPRDPAFTHSEGNSDSHIKTSLVGLSVQVPIGKRRLVLGTWQSVYFCEFDGPRNRRVSVTLMGE